jgi:hypothetical protein
MIATRAATGTCETQGFSSTIRISSSAPANSVERRPRPPYFTLLTVWPIMPQPAMPPNRLAAALAMPRPVHSRFFVARGVGEIVDDARRHHRFQQADHGDRQRRAGDDLQRVERQRHRWPAEHRQRIRQLAEIGDGEHRQVQPTEAMVRSRMQISGDGMAVVMRGVSRSPRDRRRAWRRRSSRRR